MKARGNIPWSVLGSSLWLRPVNSKDRSRVDAFLGRSDLVRTVDFDLAAAGAGVAGSPSAPSEPVAPGTSVPPPALVLWASDPVGAPAAVCCLELQGRDHRATLHCAAAGALVLRETLRLLLDVATGHPELSSLSLVFVPPDADWGKALIDAGFTPAESDSWSCSLDAPPRHLETPHAR